MSGSNELRDAGTFRLEHRRFLQGQHAGKRSGGGGIGLRRGLDDVEKFHEPAGFAFLRQRVERLHALRVLQIRARQQRHQDAGRARELLQLRSVQRTDEALDAGGIIGGDGLAVVDGLAPILLQLPQRLLQRVVEIVIRRQLERGEGHVGGGGIAIETGGTHCFQTGARRFVLGHLLEERERIRHAIAPVAEHATGGGAGARLG